MDLSLPWKDVGKMLEEQKELDAILNDDLEEFRVKHGVITDMSYKSDIPDDVKSNGNACSDAEHAKIVRATQHALSTLKKSLANYDEKKFRKWFG